jgi:hypothetical protein
MMKKNTKQSSAAELTRRLGPVRTVVKMYPAKGTESSKVLVLTCDHKSVGTPRKTLRCGRCKGSK